MNKERTFTVSWHIDVEADSPRAAAEKANEVMKNADHIPWCYGVAPEQVPTPMRGEIRVDLEEEPPKLTDAWVGT